MTFNSIKDYFNAFLELKNKSEHMKYVYHGSLYKFDIAKPHSTSRGSIKNGKQVINYEGISLHATPHKWIALSYIWSKGISYIKNGESKHFNVGVSLFNNDKEIDIWGIKSLEYSLEKIYGGGGYIYTFNAKYFKHIKGLGPLEVLSYTEQTPNKIEFIKDPGKEMKKFRVKCKFIANNN